MTAEGHAAELVAAVRNDPASRLELAAGFYDRRAGAAGIRGSPWWRSVNEGLLRDAWEARLLAAGDPGTASRPSVRRWVQFLRQPSPRAWYLAHNASIVAGYLAHRDLAEREQPLERFFMDVALIRTAPTRS